MRSFGPSRGFSLIIMALAVSLFAVRSQAQTSGANFGVRTNRFGFNITGTSGLVVVVEVCTNLTNPVWSPLSTNTLTGGSSYFSDANWRNYPNRFYRLSAP